MNKVRRLIVIYKLYIKTKGYKDYFPYGTGNMLYIKELLFDYLVTHNIYDEDEVEFKIIKL